MHGTKINKEGCEGVENSFHGDCNIVKLPRKSYSVQRMGPSQLLDLFFLLFLLLLVTVESPNEYAVHLLISLFMCVTQWQ
jgi:hypothetical protein